MVFLGGAAHPSMAPVDAKQFPPSPRGRPHCALHLDVTAPDGPSFLTFKSLMVEGKIGTKPKNKQVQGSEMWVCLKIVYP